MSSNLFYVFDGSYYAFTASGGFVMEETFYIVFFYVFPKLGDGRELATFKHIAPGRFWR